MEQMTRHEYRNGSRVRLVGWLVLLVILAAAPALAAKHPGYVDPAALVEQAGGDDAIRVEIHLSGKLLQAFATVDPTLYELVQDIHSIEAVIMEMPEGGSPGQALTAMRDISKRLKAKDWELVARLKEEPGEEVHVLVLNIDEKIEGIVVKVIDNDNELVFANIAGTIDLEAISKIGEGFGIPGLGDLGELD